MRLGTVLRVLVLSAPLGRASPFLLREVLDVAIPQGDTRLLTWLVLGMIAVSVVTGVLSVAQTWAVERRRPAGHARPADRRLPPPPAPVARVLHEDAHGRGAVADLQRHRRRAERRHEHR